MSITKSILKSQSEDDSLSIRPFFCGLVYLASYFFDLEYLETVATQLTAAIVLGIYLSIFLVLFSRCISYKLRAISNMRGTILTATTTLLVYLLTPIFPYSPIKSSTILTFFFVVFGSLIGGYFMYAFSIKSFMQTIFLFVKIEVD
jgi:hypothetical protein